MPIKIAIFYVSMTFETEAIYDFFNAEDKLTLATHGGSAKINHH